MFGADEVAEAFGVVKASSDAVATLPGAAVGGGDAAVPGVVVKGAGLASKALALESQVSLTCVPSRAF